METQNSSQEFGLESNECLSIPDWQMKSQNLYDLTNLKTTKIFFGIVYSLIFFTGISGNLCVILAVAKYPRLQTVRNVFLVNLSSSDVFVCIFSLPISAFTMFEKEWVFGRFLCYVVPLLQGMSIIISTFTLASIAIDRFILIMLPMSVKPINKHGASFMIVGIWVLAAGICVPPVIKMHLVPGSALGGGLCGYFCMEQWGEDPAPRKIYGISLFIIQFFLPLSVITLCYFCVVFKLRKGIGYRQVQKAAANKSNGTLTERQAVVLKRQNKTNKMLIGMVVAFATSWVCQVTYTWLQDFQVVPEVMKSQPYLFGIIFHSISMTSTCWNPLLYGFLNESFRTAFVEIFRPLEFFLKKKNSKRNGSQKWNSLNSGPPDETLALHRLSIGSNNSQKMESNFLAEKNTFFTQIGDKSLL